MPELKEQPEPPMRQSLFENVPPFLNYLPNGLHGRWKRYILAQLAPSNISWSCTVRRALVLNILTTWWNCVTVCGGFQWLSMLWSPLSRRRRSTRYGIRKLKDCDYLFNYVWWINSVEAMTDLSSPERFHFHIPGEKGHQVGIKSESPKGFHEGWEGSETFCKAILQKEPGYSRSDTLIYIGKRARSFKVRYSDAYWQKSQVVHGQILCIHCCRPKPCCLVLTPTIQMNTSLHICKKKTTTSLQSQQGTIPSKQVSIKSVSRKKDQIVLEGAFAQSHDDSKTFIKCHPNVQLEPFPGFTRISFYSTHLVRRLHPDHS